MSNIIWYIIAYLVGGIPFGYLIAKYAAGINIKEHGSGNIGATNVLRVLKQKDPKKAKKLAALTLFLDAFKGAAVVLAAKFAGVCDATLWTLAVLAVIGHCFSPFLKFEGGKGVATTAGVLLVLVPKAVLVALVVWYLMAKYVRISSLSSLTAIIVGIASTYILYPNLSIQSHAPLWIIAFIVIYKHKENIYRLVTGQEKRVV
ncbi:glycerol-3-phosphate 1-O-acyltransferase PlsY [Caminibacter pacificus]|uniref:Glycerol-3-phosphate acyltransferase n=1 Tax=Caminibacter pacificus TaxID=1424653 RepID=A0AAJ4RCC0_9BACT|nr:glycerol-3-phosphate 1-O-acyltransferase PlsY [Caminibacter pacificus]QCI28928.1 glycerol-3-phosphate 1-O-acyltransferase PlsY [Caminibacter pacificus]ROR39519.1 glycerol-3-phosphate acyltransferase PlsY [Caminibacter pacificus]